jgi:hypothetical protein
MIEKYTNNDNSNYKNDKAVNNVYILINMRIYTWKYIYTFMHIYMYVDIDTYLHVHRNI